MLGEKGGLGEGRRREWRALESSELKSKRSHLCGAIATDNVSFLSSLKPFLLL